MRKIVNLYFDYGGSYSKTRAEDIWNSVGHIYGLTFKTRIEEISYSELKSRICKKIGVDERTVKLQLSFIPLICKPPRASLIFNDEDVYSYLTSMDEERCRSVLHAEVIKYFGIDERVEQVSRVGGRSSFGVNYAELHSTDNVVNAGAIVHYEEPVEPVVVEPVEEQEPVEDIQMSEKGSPDAEDIGTDFMNDEHVDPAGLSQDNQLRKAWEDGLGLQVGQEFGSKDDVQDLVDRGAFQNCFVFGVVKSDRTRLVLKCRQQGCTWHLRVAKVGNSDIFSVRVYTKMHTCSRATASTSGYKRKGIPCLVACVLHDDYPGKFNTPTPKSLITLVHGRIGVKVPYSTALRGKKTSC